MSATAELDHETIRAAMPATTASVYLNTGTFGPIPSATLEVMSELATAEVVSGRLGMQGYLQARERQAALRSDLAAFVGAADDEIALTSSTWDGINTVVAGLSWVPGDEVVTTNQEHGGGFLPLYHLHHSRGVNVTFADIGEGAPDTTLSALRHALHNGVKLLLLSHVTYSTGAALPLPEICELAHSVGARVLVDGAQSVGAIPIDMTGSGVDYYAFSGQKWLCGPEGTGALYVSRERQDELQPTVVGHETADFTRYRANQPDTFIPKSGAARYENGSTYRPLTVGLARSLSWIAVDLGAAAVFRSISDLTDYCLSGARDLAGAEVLTPPGAVAGIVSVRLPHVAAPDAVTHLADHGVMVRSIPENGAIRISCGFYNTRADVDQALAALRELA